VIEIGELVEVRPFALRLTAVERNLARVVERLCSHGDRGGGGEHPAERGVSSDS
jgi:hypothetical protein